MGSCGYQSLKNSDNTGDSLKLIYSYEKYNFKETFHFAKVLIGNDL